MNYTSAVHKILDLKAQVNKRKLEEAVRDERFREAHVLKCVQDAYLELMEELKKLH